MSDLTTSVEDMKLDRAQQQVTGLAPATSAVVLGAPGTGKTSALIARVWYLLGQSDAAATLAADELLVLTPTRSSATALRDEIGVGLQIATPGPLARSIGSLAYQIVSAARVAAGRAQPALLTGADQDRIIADLLDGDIADAQHARWGLDDLTVLSSPDFRSELRALIDQATELELSPQQLGALGDGVWAGAASFIREYLEVLRHSRPDHASAPELLVEATHAIQTGQLVGELARLKTVLVDDAQELTRGGIEFLRALHESGCGVVAFGDPDIAAGSFRGVTPQGFNDLVALLGGPIVFATSHRQREAGLVEVYREVVQTLGVSARLEHRTPPRLDRRGGVRARVTDTPSGERDAIAQQLRLWHLQDEVPWHNLAVIAHDASDVALLERELASRHVPARAFGVQRPLAEVQAVHDILRIVQVALGEAAERTPAVVRELLEGTFCRLTPVALRRLRAALRQREWQTGNDRSADELMLEAFNNPLVLATLDSGVAQTAARFAQLVEQVTAAAERGETVHQLLWLVWSQARTPDNKPLHRSWSRAATQPGSSASRELDALVQLFDAAKRNGERERIEPAHVFVSEVLASTVPLDVLVGRAQTAQVAILTPAAAGGLDFDRVIIARLQDGVWPNMRLRGSILGAAELGEAVATLRSGETSTDTTDRRRAVFADELRLFARAVSRARDEVVLTGVADEDSAPSMLLEFATEHGDAQHADVAGEASDWDDGFELTLRGAVAMYRRRLTESTAEDVRQHAAAQLRLLADEGVAGADVAQWYGTRGPSIDRPLFDLDRGPVPIAPSALGSFETCSLDWVIARLGGSKPSISSAVGTLVHAASEEFPGGGDDKIAAFIDARWGELHFDSALDAARERRKVHRTLRRLGIYLDTVAAKGGVVLGNEAPFALELTEADAQRVIAVLRGKIDRIEHYPTHAPQSHDGAGTALIVDIKTGGKTYASEVKDDKQLLAYQFAYRAGAIEINGERVPAQALPPLGGARQVSLGARTMTKAEPHYRLPTQPAMTAEAADEFRSSILAAAHAMASDRFEFDADEHCMKEGAFSYAVCAPHTVKAVSAS